MKIFGLKNARMWALEIQSYNMSPCYESPPQAEKFLGLQNARMWVLEIQWINT